jgi:hypothetical protein
MPQRIDLADFERQLRERAKCATSWPFVCEGSPFDCPIFLVGINPATDVPLWQHWSIESGVDKASWLDAYRRKYGRFSATRLRIERLCAAIRPIRALETNVFHHHSKRERDLTKEERVPGVFDFLVKTLKPKIMFVHGMSAVRYLQKRALMVFDHANFVTVDYGGTTLDVLSGRHLYNWSYAQVDELGRKLKERACGYQDAGS